MQVLFLFLDKYEPLIYLVLAFFSLLVFRWLWRAWKEWRDSYFGLERELAMRRLAQAVVVALLVFVLACSELVIVSFIVPGLPASALLATPTVNLLATPSVADLTAGTPSVPEVTSIPAAPIPGSEGCVPGQLEILSPKPGENIKGSVEIVGTVDIPGFGFYKYEFASMGSDIWATISADREIKRNEKLGTWFTGALTPGDYQLRLVVTDTQGQALPPCVIPVRIVGQ